MSTNDNNNSPAEAENLDLPVEMFRTGDNVETETIRMQHRKKDYALPEILNVEVEFSEIDGLAIFEGDIVLGDIDLLRTSIDRKGCGIPGKKFRWPDGLIPFVNSTLNEVQPRVEKAIKHWEENTPLRFKLRDKEPDYISFESRDGCWSRVGRHGGKQVISLGKYCSTGSAIHEIGHALGLWHEQSRSDRDEYIEILWQNIKTKAQHNFRKHIQDGEDLGDYDFKSIMHYPEKAFGIGGKVTIRTNQRQSIGQREGLSDGDIASVKLMYPNLNWT